MAARKKRKRPLVADGPKASIAGESLSMMSATAGGIVRWRVEEGAEFSKYDLLATCETTEPSPSSPSSLSSLPSSSLSSNSFSSSSSSSSSSAFSSSQSAPPRVVGQIRAPADGKLLKRVVADGEALKAAAEPAVVATVKLCTHSTIVGGLCALCGRSVATEGAESTARQRVTMSGTASNIKVDKTEAVAIHRQFSTRLRTAKKLSLILDIDHTLLECTAKPPRFSVESMKTIQLRSGVHWVKLRPGVCEFLERARSLFEITLYTNGKREYGQCVARILDPTREYFGDRIISTPDDVPDLYDHQQKSLDRLFPGGIEMAVILDDREDVWHGEQHRHLLPIRPYRYFKHQKDKEGPIPEDACPQLNYSLEFLEKVHAGFYSEMAAQNTSAADIIETERQ
jgi:FCP1-like phosphatase family protein